MGGLELAEAHHYASSHTWLARRPRGTVRVGLDELAGRLLNGPTRVTLPKPGTVLAAGLPAATVSCHGRLASILAPVSGTVVAINPAVERDPSLLEESRYERGWLFAMKPANASFLTLPTGQPRATGSGTRRRASRTRSRPSSASSRPTGASSSSRRLRSSPRRSGSAS